MIAMQKDHYCQTPTIQTEHYNNSLSRNLQGCFQDLTSVPPERQTYIGWFMTKYMVLSKGKENWVKYIFKIGYMVQHIQNFQGELKK